MQRRKRLSVSLGKTDEDLRGIETQAFMRGYQEGRKLEWVAEKVVLIPFNFLKNIEKTTVCL